MIGFRVIDFAAGRVYNYAGQGTGNSKCGDGGLATAACLWNPTFAAVDSSNNLYFSDKGNNCIRRIDAVTGFITTLASASDPSGVAYDGNGGLYVFVKGDKKLYRINTATGVSTWIAGSGSATYLDGAPVLAGFVGGNDLTVDVATGNIYLSDTNGYAVRKISMPSGNVSTFAGNYPNYMFSSASDGKPAVGQNLFPYAMAIDTSGNVYAVEAMSRMTSNA